VGPRAGLDDAEKRKFLTLSGLELRPLSRPARSQSLYRLRYPGFLNVSRRYILYLLCYEELISNDKCGTLILVVRLLVMLKVLHGAAVRHD
jgi:hypothetical protein